MSLIDKIKASNDAAQQKALDQMTDEVRRQDEIVQTRASVVAEKVKAFATDEGFELLELDAKGLTRYFLIGDLVFAVRHQQLIDKVKHQIVERDEVWWQHFVFLVGVDITERIIELKVGTLALLRFDGVLKTYNSSPELIFTQKNVVSALYPAIPND